MTIISEACNSLYMDNFKVYVTHSAKRLNKEELIRLNSVQSGSPKHSFVYQRQMGY